MKEFIRTVKQTFQVGRQELIGYNVIAVFAGIVGVIICFIIMETESTPNSYGTIGSVMAIVMGGMLTIIGGVISVQMDFNLAISLGKIRKYYVPARFLLATASWALCLFITIIFALIEDVLYKSIYPEAFCEFSMISLVKHPALITGLVIFVPMIIMLAGALLLKFGMKCFWGFWVIWMFGCVGLPKMMTARKEAPDSFWGKVGTVFVDFFQNISDTHIVIGLIGLGIAGLATAFLLLKKQRITV